MPETFYHVDRWDDLSPGRTITLEAFEDDSTALDAAVEEYLGDGLSRHGRHYAGADLYSDDPDEVWDVACEVIFEAVRQARFPSLPSRLQSVFALRTLDDVAAFVDEMADGTCSVWEVEAERGLIADMNLVDAENLADGLYRADHYWRGETVHDDPLWEVLLVPPVRVLGAVDRQRSA